MDKGNQEMSKKKIAIISLGYAWLPSEKGTSRFYYMANTFADAGYDVELIGSSFQHFEKKPRDIEELESHEYKFKNVFIQVPPYKKNIDWRRIWSNHVAAKNVVKYLEQQVDYSAIYCTIPANNVATAVSKYCKKKNIPFIVDVEDLWPEAMRMVFDVPVISDLLYYPMKRDAKIVYHNADAVIGTSDDYTNRAFENREKNIPAETVYVGCDISQFDEGARKYMLDIKKEEGEFWVSYAGSIGTSYDIRTLIQSAACVEKQGYLDIKFKIMGTGPLLEEMKGLVKQLNCSNVDILGYVDYSKMAAYLTLSDVAVNSFVKGAPQSIVNKIGDYLASGCAMVNTLENPEFKSLVDCEKFGINVEPENVQVLAHVITTLYNDRAFTDKLSENARKCAETKFDRAVSYRKPVEIVEKLVKAKRFKEKNKDSSNGTTQRSKRIGKCNNTYI